MSKSVQSVSDHREFQQTLQGFDGEPTSYHQLFECFGKIAGASSVLLISTLPRAGAQVIQPAEVSEPLLRAYNRQFFTIDRATWQCILRNAPVRGEQCWSSAEEYLNSDFHRNWMLPGGHYHMAAAPLRQPLLPGYPGALHFYRREDQPAFNDAELLLLGELAASLDQAMQQARRARSSHAKLSPAPEGNVHLISAADLAPSACRQFIFDDHRQLQHIYHHEDAADLDEALLQQMRDLAHRMIAGRAPSTADYIQLASGDGQLWPFRAVTFKNFPALGSGPYVFFCLQPESSEWDALRLPDVQADPELMRLLPAVHFMRQEYPHSPNLDAIAAKAGLSPFHFHRRFAELMGQTPKHFLLNCQIRHAQRMLLERRAPLAEIATQCGFAHQSHFTSRFKQATGLTPTRWRRMMLQRDAVEQQKKPGCAA